MPSKKEKAFALVNKFAASSAKGQWPTIKKADLVASMLARVNNPSIIYQAGNPTCGPTTFLYSLAHDDPSAYARMIIDLYTLGAARVRDWTIKASWILKNLKPQGKADPADWIAFASLRNSENYMWPVWLPWINNLAGMTIPSTIAEWMRKAGYSEVILKSDMGHTAPSSVRSLWTERISGLHELKYQVLLLIDGDLLDEEDQDDVVSLCPTHWVALLSKVSDGGLMNYDSPISFEVWSWARKYSIPVNAAKPLPKRFWLNKFYGYVAGRY